MKRIMSNRRAFAIMDNFSRSRVLVVGDIMADHFIWGKVSRISPEAPVPVVEVEKDNFTLGGCANVLNNIYVMGGRVHLAGVVGSDETGRRLLSEFRSRGVDTGGIVVEAGRPTTLKTRIVAHGQQVVRFDREDKAGVDRRTLGRVLDYIGNEISGHDAVIVSDYKKGVVSAELMREILNKAKPKKLFISVDPKVGHFHYYQHVSLITPNVNEASIASGIDIKDEKSLMDAGGLLLKKLSCDAVLITRGEQGMSLFRNDTVVHIPTAAKNIYDVTGAGDTVIAAFTLAFAAGARMEEAAVFANHAAGIVVGEVGTAVVTPEQLRKSLGTTRARRIRKSSIM